MPDDLDALLERKAKLLEAIEIIEKGGEEIDIGDLRVRKANINWLYGELERLEKQIEKARLGYQTRVYVAFK